MRHPDTNLLWYRRGLTQDTKLVVGLPMLSSPGNLRFWITLCGCSAQDPDLAALLAEFEDAAAAGKPQLRTFCRKWNADLLRKVPLCALPCCCWVTPVVTAARQYRIPLPKSCRHAVNLRCCVTTALVLPTGAGAARCERDARDAADHCGPQPGSGPAVVMPPQEPTRLVDSDSLLQVSSWYVPRLPPCCSSDLS